MSAPNQSTEKLKGLQIQFEQISDKEQQMVSWHSSVCLNQFWKSCSKRFFSEEHFKAALESIVTKTHGFGIVALLSFQAAPIK